MYSESIALLNFRRSNIKQHLTNMDKKQELKAKEEELIRSVSSFCKEKLNDEYEQLCIKMIRKLGRKRNCPFERGNLNIWAASIVYTIGSINFLFDKSFEPYIQAKDIHDYFGTKSSTVGNKSRDIRDLLKLAPYFDKDFSTSKMMEESPANKFVEVDGFIVTVDSLPEEYQQIVKEARSRGEDVSFISVR